MRVSHRHGRAVNRVVLFVQAGHLLFVLHQVEQRVTHLVLIDADDGVSHGENFHNVRCDPEIQRLHKRIKCFNHIFH